MDYPVLDKTKSLGQARGYAIKAGEGSKMPKLSRVYRLQDVDRRGRARDAVFRMVWMREPNYVVQKIVKTR